MNYLKIAEIAHLCETKRCQINEYYRLLGANQYFDETTKQAIESVISDLKKDIFRLESSLVKIVNT